MRSSPPRHIVNPLTQGAWDIRFDWGLTGARNVSDPRGAVVVVDILSFTTAVTVAVARGSAVYPYPSSSSSADADAVRFAHTHGAALAVSRRAVSPDHPWCLSPAVLLAQELPPRLVLPSPNGSTIAASVDGSPVVAASFRNAAAVAAWLRQEGFATRGRPVTVIAAGERWPDGTLRPALEDLLGAGAVIASLRGEDRSCSPEAAMAAAAFEAARPDLATVLLHTASGQELQQAGFEDDVRVATALQVEDVVPCLRDGAFANVG
jgi:2-phosphosulfolactate phosphatase